MGTIDERIKRANSKYKAEETIDERIERVNREYEWDSRDREKSITFLFQIVCITNMRTSC